LQQKLPTLFPVLYNSSLTPRDVEKVLENVVQNLKHKLC